MEPTYRIDGGVVNMTPTSGVGGGTDLVIFSHPGTLSATISPPFEPETTSTIRRIKIFLGAVGTTTTTIAFYKSGDEFLVVAIPADTSRVVLDSVGVEFEGDVDLLECELISLGDGAQNLTIQVYGLT